MGAISGLLAGLGLVLIWQACTSEPPQWRSERSRRLGDLLIQAGAGRTSPAAFVGGSLGFGAVVALGFLGTTGVWSIAVAFGTIAALLAVGQAPPHPTGAPPGHPGPSVPAGPPVPTASTAPLAPRAPGAQTGRPLPAAPAGREAY